MEKITNLGQDKLIILGYVIVDLHDLLHAAAVLLSHLF